MLELNKISPTYRDESAEYEVILKNTYTVKDLLTEIVLNKKEWGLIQVVNGGHCMYKYGALLSTLSGRDLSKEVKKVCASGGWSNMDYYIETK